MADDLQRCFLQRITSLEAAENDVQAEILKLEDLFCKLNDICSRIDCFEERKITTTSPASRQETHKRLNSTTNEATNKSPKQFVLQHEDKSMQTSFLKSHKSIGSSLTERTYQNKSIQTSFLNASKENHNVKTACSFISTDIAMSAARIEANVDPECNLDAFCPEAPSNDHILKESLDDKVGTARNKTGKRPRKRKRLYIVFNKRKKVTSKLTKGIETKPISNEENDVSDGLKEACKDELSLASEPSKQSRISEIPPLISLDSTLPSSSKSSLTCQNSMDEEKGLCPDEQETHQTTMQPRGTDILGSCQTGNAEIHSHISLHSTLLSCPSPTLRCQFPKDDLESSILFTITKLQGNTALSKKTKSQQSAFELNRQATASLGPKLQVKKSSLREIQLKSAKNFVKTGDLSSTSFKAKKFSLSVKRLSLKKILALGKSITLTKGVRKTLSGIVKKKKNIRKPSAKQKKVDELLESHKHQNGKKSRKSKEEVTNCTGDDDVDEGKAESLLSVLSQEVIDDTRLVTDRRDADGEATYRNKYEGSDVILKQTEASSDLRTRNCVVNVKDLRRKTSSKGPQILQLATSHRSSSVTDVDHDVYAKSVISEMSNGTATVSGEQDDPCLAVSKRCSKRKRRKIEPNASESAICQHSTEGEDQPGPSGRNSKVNRLSKRKASRKNTKVKAKTNEKPTKKGQHQIQSQKDMLSKSNLEAQQFEQSVPTANSMTASKMTEIDDQPDPPNSINHSKKNALRNKITSHVKTKRNQRAKVPCQIKEQSDIDLRDELENKQFEPIIDQSEPVLTNFNEMKETDNQPGPSTNNSRRSMNSKRKSTRKKITLHIKTKADQRTIPRKQRQIQKDKLSQDSSENQQFKPTVDQNGPMSIDLTASKIVEIDDQPGPSESYPKPSKHSKSKTIGKKTKSRAKTKLSHGTTTRRQKQIQKQAGKLSENKLENIQFEPVVDQSVAVSASLTISKIPWLIAKQSAQLPKSSLNLLDKNEDKKEAKKNHSHTSNDSLTDEPADMLSAPVSIGVPCNMPSLKYLSTSQNCATDLHQVNNIESAVDPQVSKDGKNGGIIEVKVLDKIHVSPTKENDVKTTKKPNQKRKRNQGNLNKKIVDSTKKKPRKRTRKQPVQQKLDDCKEQNAVDDAGITDTTSTKLHHSSSSLSAVTKEEPVVAHHSSIPNTGDTFTIEATNKGQPLSPIPMVIENMISPEPTLSEVKCSTPTVSSKQVKMSKRIIRSGRRSKSLEGIIDFLAAKNGSSILHETVILARSAEQGNDAAQADEGSKESSAVPAPSPCALPVIAEGDIQAVNPIGARARSSKRHPWTRTAGPLADISNTNGFHAPETSTANETRKSGRKRKLLHPQITNTLKRTGQGKRQLFNANENSMMSSRYTDKEQTATFNTTTATNYSYSTFVGMGMPATLSSFIHSFVAPTASKKK